MRKKRHPLEGTNPKLETETLHRFNAPVMLITYDGLQKASVKQVDTYEIQTTAGTFHKTDVLYVLTFDAARALGDNLMINTKIEAQHLTTAYTARERTKAVNSKQLRRAVNRNVKVAMLNGHILHGTVVAYNAYNFILSVNEQTVLIYKHAVYEFLMPKTKARRIL